MKIAIVGSRSIEYDKIHDMAIAFLERYIPVNCTELVSGGAPGADKLAEEYAERYHLKMTVLEPDYGRHGKRAPLMRDEEIVRGVQYVIAFWDCRSKGTAYTVTYAIKEGIPVRIIRI